MKVAAAAGCGVLAAPLLFVSPVPQRAPAARTLGGGTEAGSAAPTQGSVLGSATLSLGLVGAAVAASAARGRGKRTAAVTCAAFDPSKELGVQAPIRFWDPAGFCNDGDEKAFARRRGVELKHGRISMLACIGYIVPEYYRFPGFLSESEGIKFEDVPNGLGALSKVPALGWAQIVLFAGLMEARFASQEKAPGDYNQGNLGLLGLLGPVTDPAEREKKLNAEIANGRLAMFAIMGMLFQNGVTGTTGPEMWGAGDESLQVYKILIGGLLVAGFAGESFRSGPDDKFLQLYPRKDYYGKDKV